MPNPVVHFEVTSEDPKRAQAFYEGLFGWTVNVDKLMGYGMVDTATGRGIGGGIGGLETPDSPNRLMIYVEVDDLQAYLDKAASLGAKTITPVTEVPGVVTFARFQDLDGNVVGLLKSDQA